MDDTRRVLADVLGCHPQEVVASVEALAAALPPDPTQVMADLVERGELVPSVVYLVALDADRIKIGCSTNMRLRMKGLRREYRGSPELLGVQLGGAPRERELHARFDHLRLRRASHGRKSEVFRADDEMHAYAASMSKPSHLLAEHPWLGNRILWRCDQYLRASADA